MSKSQLDSVGTVLWLQQAEALNSFTRMWYHVFLWALFSSIFVHTVGSCVVSSNEVLYIYFAMQVAALIAFITLRKHKFGKFFPILILLMGVVVPVVSGAVSSAAIAFVYRASSCKMNPLYALFWGVGQTVLSASVGFTRILATL